MFLSQALFPHSKQKFIISKNPANIRLIRIKILWGRKFVFHDYVQNFIQPMIAKFKAILKEGIINATYVLMINGEFREHGIRKVISDIWSWIGVIVVIGTIKVFIER